MPYGCMTVRLLLFLALLCLKFLGGVSSLRSLVSQLHTRRRLDVEACPTFAQIDVSTNDDESKDPVCSWHKDDQRCFQSGINSQDNSSFNDVRFHCAMSETVDVASGKELRVRGKLGGNLDGGAAELRFQSTVINTDMQICHPSGQATGNSNANYNKCGQRHFKVKSGGKLKLMNLHLRGGYNVAGERRCQRNPQNTAWLTCWRNSKMNDNSCSGGAIHVARGGQIVLMGVKFSENRAYKGYRVFGPCFQNEAGSTINADYTVGMNVYVEPNDDLQIGPIFALNVDQALDFKSNYDDTGFASHLLPNSCSSGATEMCRKFFHRKKCLGSTTDDQRTKSNMYCGGVCMPGYFGADLNQHSNNMTESVCKACPPGQYQDEEGQPSCTMCEVGKYNDASAQTVCVECPGDRPSPRGATSVNECESGNCTYGNEYLADGRCVACAKGKYNDELPELNNCTLCPKNTFNQDDRQSAANHDSLDDCLPCEIMHPMSLSAPGSQFCSECSAGKKYTTGGCIDCSPGYYRSPNSSNASTCDPCEKGKFQDEYGQPICLTCSAGKYQEASGQTVCKYCPSGFYRSLDSDNTMECEQCKEGRFQDHTGKSICLECAAGMYQEAMGKTVCEDCPSGFSRSLDSDNSMECERCEEGKFQDEYGQPMCFECAAGMYQEAMGKTVCKYCPSGFYRSLDSDNTMECEQCKEGRFQDHTGKSICLECAAGMYQEAMGNTICKDCPAGFSRSLDSNNTMECEQCHRGKFQNQAGKSICLSCLVGRYQNKLGQTKCKDCPVGQYQNQPEQTSCKDVAAGSIAFGGRTSEIEVPRGSYINAEATDFIKCPSGWISEEPPSSSCKRCPAGKTSPNGATDCNFCTRGKFSSKSGSSMCEDCPSGFFQPREIGRSTKCEACPVGWRQPQSGQSLCVTDLLTEDMCDDSQYLNKTDMNPENWRCAQCPKGASCKGAINQDGVAAMFGWWECPSSKTRSLIFEPCAKPEDCLGASNPELQQANYFDPDTGQNLASMNNVSKCNVGQIQDISTNRRCSACDVHYKPSDSISPGKCSPCGEHNESQSYFALAILVALLVLILLITMKMRSSGRAKASHSVLKRTLLTHVHTVSIILSLNVNWHPQLYDFLMALSTLVNVSAQGSVVQFCSELTRPKDTLEVLTIVLLIASFLPFLFCGLFYLYWMWLAPRFKKLSCGIHLTGSKSGGGPSTGQRTRTRSPRDGYIVSASLLTYIAYPSIIRVAFLMLKYVKVCDKNWVYVDEKFEYMGDQHLPIVLCVALPSIVVYCVMLPVLTLFTLAKANRKDPTVVFNYGLVYSGYADNIWYWELVIFFRKVVMILIVTFVQEDAMQLQCTLLLLTVMLHAQHRYKPFHEKNADDERDPSSAGEKNTLHQTELASLCILFFCVWSASFFKGKTENAFCDSAWCMLFAIIIIASNIILLLVICYLIAKFFARRNSEGFNKVRSRIELISSKLFKINREVRDDSASAKEEHMDYTVNIMYKRSDGGGNE